MHTAFLNVSMRSFEASGSSLDRYASAISLSCSGVTFERWGSIFLLTTGMFLCCLSHGSGSVVAFPSNLARTALHSAPGQLTSLTTAIFTARCIKGV